MQKTLVLIFVSVFFMSASVFAEEGAPAFLEPEKTGLALGLLEFPAYSFYVGAPDVNGVAYVPNFSPRLGTQLRWRSLGLIFSFGLPLPSQEVERRGNSDQSNFVLSRYWREYGVDLYFQNYKGFYVASPLTEISPNKPSRYPQLPDATIKNEGLNFYKTFDRDNYSLGAAFNQTEIQKINGGSWLFTAFYNHLEMSLGDTFVPGSDPNAIQQMPNLQSGIFDTYGMGGGYGYTWVPGVWFLTAQGVVGIGAQHQKLLQTEGGANENWSPALKGSLHLSSGCNYGDFIFGGKVLVDSLVSNVHGVQVYSSLVNAIFFAGTRF